MFLQVQKTTAARGSAQCAGVCTSAIVHDFAKGRAERCMEVAEEANRSIIEGE